MYFRIWRHLTRGDCEALQSKSRYRLGICNWNLLAFNFVQFLWTCNKKSQLCKYKIENMVVKLDAVRCHVSMILTCQRFKEAVFRFCLLFRKMRLHLKTKMMQWLYWIYILSSSTQTPLEECMKMQIIQWNVQKPGGKSSPWSPLPRALLQTPPRPRRRSAANKNLDLWAKFASPASVQIYNFWCFSLFHSTLEPLCKASGSSDPATSSSWQKFIQWGGVGGSHSC